MSDLGFIEGHHYTVDPVTGCWNWQLSTIRGYGRVDAGYVHRLAYQRLVGEIPAGYDIHHVCRNPACLNPAHLEPMDSGKHSSLHFREQKSPLTEEMVRALRERAIAGESLVLLAREYGITRWTAGDIARGDNWPDVGGPIGRPETYCLECGVRLTNRRHAKFCSPTHRTNHNSRLWKRRRKAAA